MAPKQIRIAQISDLHIKPPGQLAYGRVDTAKALERCVAALNAFVPDGDRWLMVAHHASPVARTV